jgi:hypothetical protein
MITSDADTALPNNDTSNISNHDTDEIKEEVYYSNSDSSSNNSKPVNDIIVKQDEDGNGALVGDNVSISTKATIDQEGGGSDSKEEHDEDEILSSSTRGSPSNLHDDESKRNSGFETTSRTTTEANNNIDSYSLHTATSRNNANINFDSSESYVSIQSLNASSLPQQDHTTTATTLTLPPPALPVLHHGRTTMVTHHIVSLNSTGNPAQLPTIDSSNSFFITAPAPAPPAPPAVDNNMMNSHHQSHQGHHAQQMPVPPLHISKDNYGATTSATNPSIVATGNTSARAPSSTPGRRSIHLRLERDEPLFVKKKMFSFSTHLLSRAKTRSRSVDINNNVVSMKDDGSTPQKNNLLESPTPTNHNTDLGTVVVSWYDGTTSRELNDHVMRSICRKLGKLVEDIRLLDESTFPPEEVVLTPHIPNGSRFIVKFSIVPEKERTVVTYPKAPPSPSRAPSDVDLPSLVLTSASAEKLKRSTNRRSAKTKTAIRRSARKSARLKSRTIHNSSPMPREDEESEEEEEENEADNNNEGFSQAATIIENRILRSGKHGEIIIERLATKKDEQKRVIFVLANYFVLFLSIIAISAEIHERSPEWMAWLEENVDKVNECALDSESLFDCLSTGDIRGLLASVILVIARNQFFTIRFFLFGFDSVQKLWTVVYEALVTALCWGTSYMFIRRGMNPDTSENFLNKYWKDAIYGSLAGFNAYFMKAVLKNLIPKEAIEEALDNRQLKIVDLFLTAFARKQQKESAMV